MKKFDLDFKIYTERLILTTNIGAYKFDICREFTPEITTYMPFDPTGDIRVTEDFVVQSDRELEEGSAIHFCILDKKSNIFLGICALHDTQTKNVELGLWLKKSVHGMGFGTQTVTTLIEFAKKEINPDCLIYPVDRDNIASRKIPEKLGFTVFKTYEKKKNESVNLNLIEFRKKLK